jgi:hypothetical protein
MTPSDQDPVPHDPWLREALRHAPDADAGPPPKLNDTILRMGRAAVAPRPAPAPPRPPTLAQRLLAAWDWLARPPVAAGFASVMVATVVGVMWWGRPIEEALPPREASVPEAQAPAPAVVAAAPAPAVEAPPARTAEPDKRRAQERITAAMPEPALRKSAPPAAATPPAAPPAPPAPPAAPAPVAPAAPSPAQLRDALAQQNAAAAAEEGVRLRGSAERRELAVTAPATSSAPGAAGAAAADAAAPPAGLGALSALRSRAAVGTIESPGLSNLRFEIPRRQADWTWQRDDGPARPIDDAMTNWIALADRTSRPHWNPGNAAGEGAVATLRFTRDGVVRAILRVGPKGLRLDRGGKTESAELSGAQVNVLISGLDALGP